ncbi:MAG: hypothetical protein ACRENP_12355 [Longimicrobiales bacterium]
MILTAQHRLAMVAAWCVLVPYVTHAQEARRLESAQGVPRFALEASGLSATGTVRPWAYLSDAGQRAAAFGTEAGVFEVWTWPLRLVRDLRFSFKIPTQDLPMAGADVARRVVVRPEGSTIVYSHPGFTVRQHVLVPVREPVVLMLLEVETTQRLEIMVRMRADFGPIWSGLMGGGSITWQPEARRFHITQGGVQLFHALIGSPLASEGIAQSAHDAAHATSQFVLRLDPAMAAASYIPIVIAGGSIQQDSTEQAYARAIGQAQQYWRDNVEHYRRSAQDQLSVVTPDAAFDRALEWSKVNLDQQVRGFAAFNAIALSAVGQLDRVREELRQLARLQTADGRIPQDAPATMRLPRLTGAAAGFSLDDATPFWVLGCHNYWAASGDDSFIREQRSSLLKAFRHITAAATSAPDLYQAGLLAAALERIPAMAQRMGDMAAAAEASAWFDRLQRTMERQYWLEQPGIYAAGVVGQEHNAGEVLTAYPTMALAFGLLDDVRSNRALREMGSSALTADWGIRAFSSYHRMYDARAPDRGAVRPDLSADAAMAHYRYHRSWAAYDLMQDLTRVSFDFARGRTPESLSGAFYNLADVALHTQLSTSAPLVTPLVSGLLGLQVDAPNRALSLEPHLPAEWGNVTINSIRLGRERISIEIRRDPGHYAIALRREGGGATLFVRLAPALPLGARVERVRVNDSDAPIQVEESAHDLHAVVEVPLIAEAEIEIEYRGGFEVIAGNEPYDIGDPSNTLRVLDFRRDAAELVVLVEGVPAATYLLRLRAETRVRSVTGAEIVEQTGDRLQLRVRFGAAMTPFARREIRIRTG